MIYFILFYFILFFSPHPRICSLILEREGGERRESNREKERGRNIDVRKKHHWLPPVLTQTGDGTYDLGICPNQESNPQLFGVRDNASTN